MPIASGSFSRDANNVPLTALGLVATKSITLTGSNTTVVTPLFTLTGSVKVVGLYGVVTTTLGSNQTAAYFRLNDQTAQVDISLATGTTVSNMGVGSLLTRKSIASVALTADNSTAGKVTDPVAATATDVFMPFVITQKVGGVTTQIEYVYTTTQTPTTGAITFYCGYIPLTAASVLVAA